MGAQELLAHLWALAFCTTAVVDSPELCDDGPKPPVDSRCTLKSHSPGRIIVTGMSHVGPSLWVGTVRVGRGQGPLSALEGYDVLSRDHALPKFTAALF